MASIRKNHASSNSSSSGNNRGHSGIQQLGDFTSVDRRLVLISLLGIIVGVASAFVAVALLGLIDLFTNLFYFGRISFQASSPAQNSLGILAVAVPVVGGLIIGLTARYGSERIRGHGIPEALEAILIGRSKIQPRVTVLKPVSTAISIGSGGPFGAEGPVIMTGGAFGSVFSQFLKLSSMERKTLLVAGAAAGMAAVFNSPISAVLLAVELLLFEWKPRSLIPVGIASAISTLLRGMLIGTGPLFAIPATPVPDISIAVSAAIVGVAAGGASTALTYAVYAAEDFFHRLPIHWMWWPAIGGLVIGLGGLFSPHALGVGYDTIDSLLLGNLAMSAIIILVVVKAVIWAVSLGSGTSGGVLAPLLIIGGSVGAIMGQFLPFGSPPLWVLVSMGAIIGGTMRSPFTGVVFSLELTRDFNALLPLVIAALVAEGITVFTMKRSILTEKIARRGVHVSREYSVDVMELTPVHAVMHKDFTAVSADTPMAKIAALYDKSHGRTLGYPVVDAVGAMQGFLSPKDVVLAIEKDLDGNNTRARDILPESYTIAFPDETLKVAIDKMAQVDSESLPVVDPSDPQRVIGVVSRQDLFRARVVWSAEERNRERVFTLSTAPLRGIANERAGVLRRLIAQDRAQKYGGNDAGDDSSSR